MTRLRAAAPDLLCVTVLVLVWAAFFWRLLTPNADQQVSLARGDFSAQFAAFGAYQQARLSAGEIPLWDPYNNGGLPFIADTQAAVFYPPRLLTIALANLAGTGWIYHALELEMVAHVLVYVLLFYALARRLTAEREGSPAAALAAALVAGFGGYTTGYPPLQLALLEAAIWFPAVMLALHEATRRGVHWRWIAAAGWFLGISWMAGHPQTSFFLTVVTVAYGLFRLWTIRARAVHAVAAIALVGGTSVGVVAVTLLPGLEYLMLTSRAGFDYAAKSTGFPVSHLLQIGVPNVVSQWSPLWIGAVGLLLAAFAITRPSRGVWFWFGVLAAGLLFSLGANGPVYPLLYNVVPGLSFFRGQERAAFLVANAAAILVGYGAIQLGTAAPSRRRILAGAGVVAVVAVCALVIEPKSSPQYALFAPMSLAIAVIASICTAGMRRKALGVLIGLAVFELLVVSFSSTNYESRPPEQQINTNPLIGEVQQRIRPEERVDGRRVLGGNWGSYYRIADIHGISPLFLAGPQAIIEEGLPDERAWELFAVRYVYSDWAALPVPSEVIARGEDSIGPVNLHRLTAPRPFAHFVYDVTVVDSDEDARLLLADPTFNPRTTAILHQPPLLSLVMEPREHYASTVTLFEPERIVIDAETPDNAILSLAMVNYPGWRAAVDGQDVPLMRAYGGLSALELPAGKHTVELYYEPIPYRIGVWVSAVTWLILLAGAGVTAFARLRRTR